MLTDVSAQELPELVDEATSTSLIGVTDSSIILNYVAAAQNSNFLFERKPDFVLNTIVARKGLTGSIDHYIAEEHFGSLYEVVAARLDLSDCGEATPYE